MNDMLIIIPFLRLATGEYHVVLIRKKGKDIYHGDLKFFRRKFVVYFFSLLRYWSYIKE